MADDNKLLGDIKSSIQGMQSEMQDTYKRLADLEVEGESNDKTVKIIMTATYNFVDIQFNEEALKGGVKEFKWRIREAWKNLSEAIQKTTQEKTIELLQGMDIPEEIRNLDIEGGEGGQGAIGNGSAGANDDK